MLVFFRDKYPALILKQLYLWLYSSQLNLVLYTPIGYVNQFWVIEFNVTMSWILERCWQPYFREICYLYYASTIDKTGKSTRNTNQTATLTCYQMSVCHLPGTIAVFNAHLVASKYAWHKLFLYHLIIYLFMPDVIQSVLKQKLKL